MNTGRTLEEVLKSLPKDEQERIDARYRALKDEVESLKALRHAAGKAQVEIAQTLKISQPSVSKIEKQTDMYLSTLRSYVKAVGGDLDLVVRFPSHGALTLRRLGDAFESKIKPSVPAKRLRARAGEKGSRHAAKK
jgi:transcriptional regulator with XRE-family HTH domain